MRSHGLAVGQSLRVLLKAMQILEKMNNYFFCNSCYLWKLHTKEIIYITCYLTGKLLLLMHVSFYNPISTFPVLEIMHHYKSLCSVNFEPKHCKGLIRWPLETEELSVHNILSEFM